MRQGTLLVEDNPLELLKKYSSSSLEDVFLKGKFFGICLIAIYDD